MTAATVGARLDQGQVLAALQAFRRGDFSARLPPVFSGVEGEIAKTFNEVIELADGLTREIERVGKVIGEQGKTAQRAQLPNAAGSWKANAEAINTLLADIVRPTEEIARVIEAVANGDLSQTVGLHAGRRSLPSEFHRIGTVVNSMVAQLDGFVSEVTRVAREVGTEGKLGGQAKVPGVAGTWKELTDNVNAMAANLTSQVRNIAEVTTAVANGDLSKKITANDLGEVLE
jgi:methyl-accepting chemotaxis protein